MNQDTTRVTGDSRGDASDLSLKLRLACAERDAAVAFLRRHKAHEQFGICDECEQHPEFCSLDDEADAFLARFDGKDGAR